MIRRIALILLIILNIFAISGCWDKTELEKLGIVSGVGIESASGGRIRLIVQTINTAALAKGSGGSGLEFQKAYRNTVVEGDTLYDAVNKLALLTATKRTFSHTTVFIVSEDLARERGVREILDVLERDSQVRLDSWLIVGKGNLTNLLDIPGRISQISADRITDIINFRGQTLAFAPLKLGEFIRLLQSESTQPYTAVVEYRPNTSVPNYEGNGILGGNVPEPLYDIAMNGTAVFKQDKLVGWLNDQESRGLLWLRGEVKEGPLSFSVPGENAKTGTSIVRAKTELKPQIENGQVYITVNIEVESKLEEELGRIDVEKTSEIDKLQVAQGKEITEEVRAALQKAQQEYMVDVFGFGEEVHRSYSREWKQLKPKWSDLFPNVQVDIQVNSKITHTSLVSKPAEPAQK